MRLIVLAAVLAASPAHADYVEGRLVPREVCKTVLEWQAAPPLDERPDTSNLGAPGERVYWGDRDLATQQARAVIESALDFGTPRAAPIIAPATPTPAAVPNPAAFFLFACGLVGLVFAARQKT